jgi:hypothetical protein
MTYLRTLGASFVALWAFALASVASAQTGTTSTTTPGVPDTGVGGDPTTLLAVLGIAAVVAIIGGTYLLWERRTP